MQLLQCIRRVDAMPSAFTKSFAVYRRTGHQTDKQELIVLFS